MDLPEQMRAWVHTTNGPPATVLTLTNVPVPPLPRPNTSDVLVKITHATVCSGGAFMVTITPSFLRDKPCIPEFEFTGQVVAVGDNTSLQVGEHVFGTVPIGRVFKRQPGAVTPSGALAEYVVVPSESVARRPEGVAPEEAAGLGGVSTTTAMTVMRHANLQKGQKVMVYGASSAVGSFVVQMAKEAVGETGKVVGVCGSRGLEVVKDLGADEVIDRTSHDPIYTHLADLFRNDPFDAVLDTFGVADIYTHCEPYLKPDGPFVSVGISFQEWTLFNALSMVALSLRFSYLPKFLGGTARKWVPIFSDDAPSYMERIAKEAGEGRLRTHVDSVCSMEDALTAYERVINRKGIGKVVVKIQDA